MTTYTIPSTDLLRDLHRIARRHGLRVNIEDLDITRPERRAPYRWRVVVRNDNGGLLAGAAAQTAQDLAGAVRDVWQNLMRWDVA